MSSAHDPINLSLARLLSCSLHVVRTTIIISTDAAAGQRLGGASELATCGCYLVTNTLALWNLRQLEAMAVRVVEQVGDDV